MLRGVIFIPQTLPYDKVIFKVSGWGVNTSYSLHKRAFSVCFRGLWLHLKWMLNLFPQCKAILCLEMSLIKRNKVVFLVWATGSSRTTLINSRFFSLSHFHTEQMKTVSFQNQFRLIISLIISSAWCNLSASFPLEDLVITVWVWHLLLHCNDIQTFVRIPKPASLWLYSQSSTTFLHANTRTEQ